MSEHGPRLERFFERAIGLGTAGSLHPARLLQEVQEAARTSIRDGSIANAYRIGLSPKDGEFYAPHHARIRREVVRLLEELAASRRLRPPGPWLVEFADVDGSPGSIRVDASYRNDVGAAPPPPSGVTQAITRHRGKFLMVEGLGRVALTHTPFVIGRGRDCDLTIPDLSISRRHARLETLADGSLILRDVGSRNQLKVEEGTLSEVVLSPGLRVELGSTALWLEVAE